MFGWAERNEACAGLTHFTTRNTFCYLEHRATRGQAEGERGATTETHKKGGLAHKDPNSDPGHSQGQIYHRRQIDVLSVMLW